MWVWRLKYGGRNWNAGNADSAGNAATQALRSRERIPTENDAPNAKRSAILKTKRGESKNKDREQNTIDAEQLPASGLEPT